MIKIENKDCLIGLRELKNNSVDLIVIDPPYNIKKASWDKWKTVNDYVEFMGEVFKECERVLKDNGSFYFFHNDFMQIVELQNYINKNTNFIFKQLIVWNKRFDKAKNLGFLNGFIEPKGLRNYQKMVEYCLFYTFQDETGLSKIKNLCFEPYLNYMTEQKEFIKWDNKEFNNFLNYKSISSHWFWQDKEKTKQSQPRFISENDYLKLQTTGYFQKPYEELRKEYKELRKEYEELRKEYEELRYTFNNQKTHHSVWNYEIAKKQGHITPKPVELIENIIKHSSNENDVVLDCFLGSGTTAVACKNLNRNFIGFEINEEYIKIANDRLRD